MTDRISIRDVSGIYGFGAKGMAEQGLPRINNLVRCVRTAQKTAYPEDFVSGRVELSCRKLCERAVERYEDANPGRACGEPQLLSVLVDNCLLERSEAREIVEAWKAGSDRTVTYRAERRYRLQQVLYDELASCNAHLELRPDSKAHPTDQYPSPSDSDQTVETAEHCKVGDHVSSEPIDPIQTQRPRADQAIRRSSRRIMVAAGLTIVLFVVGMGYFAGATGDHSESLQHPRHVLSEAQAFDGQPPFVETTAAIRAELATLVCFWMKPGGVETEQARAILGWGEFSTGYNDHFLLALPSDQSIRLNREQPRRDGESGYTVTQGTAPGALEIGRWQHIAVVFDSALTNPVRLYIDGVQQVLSVPPGGESGKPWPGTFPLSDVFFVGGREDFEQLDNFIGEIGPVTLLQRVEITDEDVQQEMERFRPGGGER